MDFTEGDQVPALRPATRTPIKDQAIDNGVLRHDLK